MPGLFEMHAHQHSMEPGRLADLVVVNGDPLTNIRDALNLEQVIHNGDVPIIDALLKQP